MKQLAESTGFGRSRVSRMVLGTREIKPEEAQKIAEILGVEAQAIAPMDMHLNLKDRRWQRFRSRIIAEDLELKRIIMDGFEDSERLLSLLT